MSGKKTVIQAAVCLGILTAVTGLGQGLTGGDGDKFGSFLEKVSEAVRENYTLAELLQIGQEASAQLASVPERVSQAVIAINEESLYGLPLDEQETAENTGTGENTGTEQETVQQVFAVAGGRVMRCGLEKDLGLYIMIEHPESASGKGKISTYGHLSDVKVVTGDRIRKGDTIGFYDSSGGTAFYYVLEEKS